jgi:methylated-DNA-[protein]-cysteine S-methyltransferase
MTAPLYYTVLQTPAGWLGLLGSAAGLRRVALPQRSGAEAAARLGEETKKALSSAVFFKDTAALLLAYFSGKNTTFPVKLDTAGTTPFQCAIWAACRTIPYGETRSYSWVASQAGNAKAVRAAGQALGKNPFPIIVPCHRVITAGGGIGGFSDGLSVKTYLLQLERDGKAPYTA